MRLLAALGALSLILGSPPAFARPYTVEDLLATESIGGVTLDPTGRWAVIAHNPAWATAPRFDHAGRTELTLGTLDVVDLVTPSPRNRLFEHEAGAGYSAGPVSPSGRYMLVFRLQNHVWTAGVVTIAQRRVRWLDLTPEFPVYGRVAQWRSDAELLLITRQPGVGPRQLRLGWDAGARLPMLWAAQAKGQNPTAHVVGSGRYLGQKAAPTGAGLVSVTPETGHIAQLESGEFVDLEISPNGRHVALFGNAESIQPGALDRVTASFPTRRRYLKLVDLQTKAQSEPCAGCDFHLRLLSWAPNGRELLVARRGDHFGRPELVRIRAQDNRVTRLDLKGLAPSLGYTGEGGVLVAAEWIGSDPIVYAHPTIGGRSDWYRLSAAGPLNLTAQLQAAPPRRLATIQSDGISLIASGAAWAIDRQGHTRSLSKDRLESVPLDLDTSLGARFNANPIVREVSPLARRGDPDGDVLIGLYPALGTLGRLGRRDTVLAANQYSALIHRRTASGVASIEFSQPGGATRRLLTINSSLAGVTPARILPIAHGPAEAHLTSWLYLPEPKSRGADKPPLVVMPYPSAVFPQPAISTLPGELRFPIHPQVLAGAGYAVLMPSLPFDRSASEPMRGVADQILAVVDKAVATGEVDGDRVALLGHSFGAYAAMASASQTDRFKAIVAVAGISDLVSYWGVMPLHYRVAAEDGPFYAAMAGLAERGHPHQEGPPWRDPARYIRNSPLFFADQITTPLMLVHGDQDEVGFNQSEEMFAALYRQGKTAQFVTYWGEGHAIISPANVRDFYKRVLEFLSENLGEGRRLPDISISTAPEPADATQQAARTAALGPSVQR